MKTLKKILTFSSLVSSLLLFSGLFAGQANAVTGRHPTGVNVNTNGTSTVLITFQNLAPGEVPVDAFWCGDVTSSGVVLGTNPCVAGTLLGHLPRKFDLSSITGSPDFEPRGDGSDVTPPKGSKGSSNNIGPRNLTDVMSIPSSVVRRAYQETQRGASSEFYYIRQFVNNGVNTYVTVTCRMGGGGARSPLALTKVDLNFGKNISRSAVTLVKQSQPVDKFSAKISFNGSGLLKGRWEIVMPGDVEPTRFDLLSEASLPAAERMLQKRYRLISRFQKFLAPTGQTIIPGPDPKLLPTMEKGMYRILLRIEASNDKEGSSDTTAGLLKTGGVAGFPMPTLRYFVGEREQLLQAKSYPPVSLLLPHDKQILSVEQINFSWFGLQDSKEIAVYKVEFYEKDGEQKLLASALRKPSETNYKPAKQTLKKLNRPFLWRVVAVDKTGKVLSTSQLRQLEIKN